MRAFVKLRELLATHKDLARKLEALEQKYDTQFKVVFDAIRQLMTPPAPKAKRIGFRAGRWRCCGKMRYAWAQGSHGLP